MNMFDNECVWQWICFLTPPFLCSLFDSDGSVFYGVTFEDGEVRESVESHLVAACSNDTNDNNDNNDNKKVDEREVEGETVEQVIERRRSFRKQKRDKEKEDRDIQKNLER